MRQSTDPEIAELAAQIGAVLTERLAAELLGAETFSMAELKNLVRRKSPRRAPGGPVGASETPRRPNWRPAQARRPAGFA